MKRQGTIRGREKWKDRKKNGIAKCEMQKAKRREAGEKGDED